MRVVTASLVRTVTYLEQRRGLVELVHPRRDRREPSDDIRDTALVMRSFRASQSRAQHARRIVGPARARGRVSLIEREQDDRRLVVEPRYLIIEPLELLEPAASGQQ